MAAFYNSKQAADQADNRAAQAAVATAAAAPHGSSRMRSFIFGK